MFQTQTFFVYVIALIIINSSLSLDGKEMNVQKTTTFTVYNLSTLNITKKNAILSWNVENLDEHYPEKYNVYIIYRSACDMTWQILNINEDIIQNVNENQFTYAFERLCPNKMNTITLCTNSTNENITIPSLKISFDGLPHEPFFSPIIDPGSFSIDEIGNLYLFWKRIDPTDYNGNNYTIQITNENKYSTYYLSNRTIDKGRYYATLQKDWFNITLGAKFKLLSSNIVGPAEEASFIEISSINRLCGKPENIQVVRFGNNYHVSWTKPLGDYDITSYTVFWCSSSNDSTYCDAPINFTRVNGTLQFNIRKSDQHLKFAISANTENSTSGMTWEQCKAETDSTLIGQIESITNINIATHEIELEWAPKCKDTLIVKNYTVEYCPVEKRNSDCFETKITHITNTTTYSLDDLKSNTLYKVNVTMQSATTKGPPSIHYFKTALPVWLKFASYIILGVFLMIIGISVYWCYCKLSQYFIVHRPAQIGAYSYTTLLRD